MRLAGTADGPDGQLVPNITPDPGTGIGKWEKEDVVELLRTGTTPEQGKVKGAMRETIQDGLKYLSDADLDAIADPGPVREFQGHVEIVVENCTAQPRHGKVRSWR